VQVFPTSSKSKSFGLKVVMLSALSALVLGALPGEALAKRRRVPRPAPVHVVAPPATEVDVDVNVRPLQPTVPAATSATPVSVSASASGPDGEKAVPDVASPIPDPPRARFSTAASGPASAEVTASARGRDDRESLAGRVGAHVGVASPLVTLRASNNTRRVTSVNDDFTLVAPIGLGIKLSEQWTFDFEVQVTTGVRPEGLTTLVIDPGVLYGSGRVAAGLRVAWQLNVNQNVGLIPLIRVGLVQTRKATWFAEASAPAFVQNKQLTASGSLQTGIGF
jgi:hypothetical protein